MIYSDAFEEMEPHIPEVWSGDGEIRTDEQMKECAEKVGCTYEEADSKTLFIDIDSEAQLATFHENIRLADRLFNIDKRKFTITPSKSGEGRWHIRVPLPHGNFSLLERVLLQACLGSDLKREMISMKRAQNGEENVVVFFEKKK